MTTETSLYYWNTNIYIQIYIFNNILLKGKDFQSADSAGIIATAIWDMAFPALEQGTKTTKNNLT